MAETAYAEALGAYRDAATGLFAQQREVLAEAQTPALEPYAEARAEELVRRSAQLEAAAADAARSGDPDVRELANLQLSALAALDLAAADDLLTGAAQEGQAMLESEASTWAQAHAELSPLLELSPMLGYSQLLAERPEEGLLDEDVATARAELLERAGTAIDEIIAQAAGGTAKAVEGLAGMGGGTLLKAASETADLLLGQLARQARRLVRWAVKLVTKAVSKLLRILGPQLEKAVRKQVGGWLAQLKLTDALDTALKWLYDDQVLKAEAQARVQSAPDALGAAPFKQTKADLDDLVGRFGWHARILGWIAKALEKLQGKLMALAPWAPVAVAAVWLLMLGYAVVVGGDHLDWHRLGDEGTFDVVLGVRRTVDIGLAGAS